MKAVPGDDRMAICEHAQTLPPERRAAYLDQACGGDPALRAEIEAMLADGDAARDYFESLFAAVPGRPSRPSTDPGVSAPPSAETGSLSGHDISHYRVLDRLGKGGMGVVYQAEDIALGRTVALKFLPPHLSMDDHARQRFAAEAQAASALDHPNICTIYEIGGAGDGQLFIAMAYYAGQTLRQKIETGPLPAEQALDFAVQTARGLAKAHASGIIHRDVKPANLMVTEDGIVKILDFGLAKASDLHLTQTGATLGTVAYMSPEQAKGEPVDHRADVWALGVVLYEMLTGERPFRGDYAQAVFYHILYEEPAPFRAPGPEAEGLAHVIAMCLEKDPAHRYPSMGDLLADLEMLQRGGASGSSLTLPPPPERPAARAPRRAPRRALLGAGLGVAVLTALLLIPPVRQALFGGGVSIPDHRFLAVLPFDNVGNVAENQAFIDGLVYTVTSTLTEMEQFQDALSVVPARDVLEAGRLSTRAAAERFGVNLVLAGSVQRSERGVRIHLQLVDPARERVLASRQLDEPALDIAALQDDVVFELADLLEVEMNPAAERALTAGRTAVPVAFDFYTQALGYLQRFEDETNLDAAISLFGLAIKEDSSYALAYAGLGEAYLHRYQASNAAGDVEAALRNGERAVALGDDLAPVHVALGRIYFETGRYDRAELEYLRALVLEPKNAAAHHALGAVYARLGKDDDAEASYQQAIALKPDYWLYHNDLGQFYHRLGRHREALPKFKDVIALQPGNPWGYNNVGAQYARLGRTEEAITWYQKAATINPHAQRATAFANYNLGGIYYGRDDFAEAARRFEQVVAYFGTDRDAWENLGDAYHWGGDPAAARAPWQRAVALARERLAVNQADPGALGALAEDYARLGEADSARAAIERLLALDEPSTASLVSVAKAYEILGRRDDALTYLAAALDRGYAPVILDASAWLDALRQDPRYQQLVRTGRTAETD